MFRLRPLFSRARSTLAIGAFELPAAAPPGPTVLQRVNAFAKAQPLAVSIVGARPPDSGALLRKSPTPNNCAHVASPPPTPVTGCKAAAADCLVQVVVEGRERVDRKRMAMFFAFGAGYQGCAQYWMLNHWFEWWFTAHRFSTAKKVLAANLIADPVFFFPTFYSLKEILATGECTRETVPAALAKYRSNLFEDIRNSWMIWFPTHMVTYALVPIHLRMPWVACVSFGYVGLVSMMRGAFDKPPAPAPLSAHRTRSIAPGPLASSSRPRWLVAPEPQRSP